MVSNRVILCASLLYSLILVLFFTHEPISIIGLIRIIGQLLGTNEWNLAPKDHGYSIVYSNVMKGAFVYSIATVFLSKMVIFASFSSLRDLTTAITRNWKPFLASLVAALIFPFMLHPPSNIVDNTFGAYFIFTICHALFVVYFSLKLVTLPMFEEKFGKDVEIKKSVNWKLVFLQILVSIMEIGRMFLPKEAYKMQLVFGVGCEAMLMIWLASLYVIMAFAVLINENRKKLAKAKISSSEKVTALVLLCDESLP